MIKRQKSLWCCSVMLATAGTLHPLPSAAQESAFNVEILPYAVYRIGGTFEEENGDGEFELRQTGTRQTGTVTLIPFRPRLPGHETPTR